MGRCGNRSYAARARFELAVVKFPEGFTRARGPGHAATASPTPSKPVAPIVEKWMLPIYPLTGLMSTAFDLVRNFK